MRTMSLTVTQLARACGLSRGTLLYYESLGLVRPPRRSEGNYRLYGDKDLERLRQVCVYRDAGPRLGDIRSILDAARSDAGRVLERRLAELAVEIERLREHQRAIARLLKRTDRLRRTEMVTKEKWVEIMRATGFTDEDMHRWHAQFEQAAPQEHQEFLEFLHIPADEVKSIREWSREQARG
jgi:DNA-binding transcriptional MerR regulator